MQPQETTVTQPVYALNPLNNRWEYADVVDNPDNKNMPLLKFSDGNHYAMSAIQQTTNPAAIPTGEAANEPTPVFEKPAAISREEQIKNFKFLLTRLDSISLDLFNLPVDVIMQMIYRNAVNQELQGNGQMRIFAGQSQFVPDQETFGKWFDAYANEVEARRRDSDGGPEG